MKVNLSDNLVSSNSPRITFSIEHSQTAVINCMVMKNSMIRMNFMTSTIQIGGGGVVHCCTLSLLYLGAESDDHNRNPNVNTEII